METIGLVLAWLGGLLRGVTGCLLILIAAILGLAVLGGVGEVIINLLSPPYSSFTWWQKVLAVILSAVALALLAALASGIAYLGTKLTGDD